MSRNFVRASSQYLEIDSAPVTAAPFTVSIWGWSDDLTNTKNMFFLGDKDVSNNLFALLVINTEVIRWISRNSSSAANTDSAAGTWQGSQWNNVVCVERSDSDREVYYNGSSVATNTTTVAPSGVDRLSIGRNGSSSPGNYWDDRLAEFAIWDVALDTAEIAALAKGVSPLLIRPGSLVFYLPMIRDVDRDIIGGLALTAVNTPTVAEHLRMLNPTGVQVGQAVAAGGAFTMEADAGVFTLTGVNTGLLAARRLGVDVGTFVLSGQAASLLRGYPMAAGVGSFSLAGLDVTLLATRRISAEVGSFSLAGLNVGLLFGRRVAAEVGSYTLTGLSVSLLAARRLGAEVGALTLTGVEVEFMRGFGFAADAGVFTLTGVSASLLAARRLASEAGSFVLGGQAASLLRGYPMAAGVGSFTLAGVDVSLLAMRRIGAGAGSFVLTGQAVTLSVLLSGVAVAWSLQARSVVWSLQARDLAWDLQDRNFEWTLQDDPR